ncbi:hypothetical protein ACPOL_6808 (plasmid) [Acidisarcina polymorpha]|uniref:Uncharacterized protein n=1 Tax=Acidisarcina polymorpha TaxID=2211140 RepID=A0A2Z5GAJ1_9BACT|nr:hypothetical protein ACPOL_6808 [Acidisarcina polymorpha]
MRVCRPENAAGWWPASMLGAPRWGRSVWLLSLFASGNGSRAVRLGLFWSLPWFVGFL